MQFQNPFGHPTTINSSSAPTLPVQPGTDVNRARVGGANDDVDGRSNPDVAGPS